MNSDVRLNWVGEQEWNNFYLHVEWGEHFGLFFLFCSNLNLSILFQNRLKERFLYRGTPIKLLSPAHAETCAEEIMDWVRSYSSDSGCDSSFWLDLSRDQDTAWIAARDNLIARLNEHRELLRNKLSGSLIIILPEYYRARLRELAPDLWSIRQYSLSLNSEEHCWVGLSRSKVEKIITPPIITKWYKLRLQNTYSQKIIQVGEAAYNAALGWHCLDLAREVAKGLLDIARNNMDQHKKLNTMLKLSSSLSRYGWITQVTGYFEEAESAYREEVTINKELRDWFGDTLEILENLCRALDHVSFLMQMLGRYKDAQVTLQETSTIRRLILSRSSSTHKTLRNLCITLDQLGWVMQAQNCLEEALGIYSEALDYWKRDNSAFPNEEEAKDQIARLQKLLVIESISNRCS